MKILFAIYDLLHYCMNVILLAWHVRYLLDPVQSAH